MKPASLGNFPAALLRNYQQAISLAMVTRESVLQVPGQVSHQVRQRVNTHAVTGSRRSGKWGKDLVAPASLLSPYVTLPGASVGGASRVTFASFACWALPLWGISAAQILQRHHIRAETIKKNQSGGALVYNQLCTRSN